MMVAHCTAIGCAGVARCRPRKRIRLAQCHRRDDGKTTACAPTGGQERRQPVGLSARPSERMAERNRSRYVADVTPRLRSIMRWDCIHQSILDKREYTEYHGASIFLNRQAQ